MGALSYFSPGDILKSCPLELGMGAFCFLVAELLTARYRLAALWRLTDRDRKRYAHVFLRVGGVPLDIKGFRRLDAMRFEQVGVRVFLATDETRIERSGKKKLKLGRRETPHSDPTDGHCEGLLSEPCHRWSACVSELVSFGSDSGVPLRDASGDLHGCPRAGYPFSVYTASSGSFRVCGFTVLSRTVSRIGQATGSPKTARKPALR